MLKRFGSICYLLHSSNCSEKTAPMTRLFFPSSLSHAFIAVIWSTFKIHTESEHLTPVCTSVYQSLSHAWLLVALYAVAHQAPLSVGFSRQEYRSGLPFPSPGDFPDPGIEPRSPELQADSLLQTLPGKPSSQDILQRCSSHSNLFIEFYHLKRWLLLFVLLKLHFPHSPNRLISQVEILIPRKFAVDCFLPTSYEIRHACMFMRV